NNQVPQGNRELRGTLDGSQQYINLATHNVRGVNLSLKQQLWMDHYYEENFHIVS
ncbi:37022_t:CDS:1, partial [Gigaspora margarita]